MSSVALASLGAWIFVVVLGALFRSRAYAIFRGVTLGIHTLIALALFPYFGVFTWPLLYLHAAVYADSLFLIRPTLRPLWYRVIVSWPAQYMAAATFLAFPWAIAAAFGLSPWGLFVPYVLGAVGMLQSLTSRSETRDILVGDVEPLGSVVRVDASKSHDQELHRDHGRPLRVAQITDPHLGPFMPIGRLRRICERIVEQDPDLVFLTGDFLTMESQKDARHLTEALSPLARLPGRVFACMGNHDHEAPKTVHSALRDIGATLLIDQAEIVETAVGRVQILGFDFHFRGRRERMDAVCAQSPRVPGVLRLALLHDPGAFKHMMPGEVDLAFSGHTHGGQVGLVSLGFVWTVAGWVAKIPDHGLWGHGKSRLYVHRGTGHYGFPLRLGVPAEESILSIYGRRQPLL
jgi:predicted MPP superfamily phosphohydrolase